MKNFDLVNYLAKNKLQEAIELKRIYPENPDEVAQKVADHFTETDDLGLIYSVKPESLKMTSQGAYFNLDVKAGPNTPGEDWADENGFGIDYYLGDSAGGSFVIKSEEGLDDDFFVIRNMANRNAKVGSVTPEGEVIFSTQEDNLEETKSNKMTKAQLKEMIRQNILNELAEEITEDTDVEFGDPDVGLSKLYADFYEGLEEQEEEEVEDTEKVDVSVEEPAAAAPAEPTLTDTEREIQSNLDKALQAAQELGNEKLIQQIGNTITFFTRDFVVKEGEESVNEAFLAVTTNGVTKADDTESFISQMEDAGYKLAKILGPKDNLYKDHPTIDHTWTYGLPKFNGIIGPMKDGDRFRYEDQETYDRMSLEEKKDKEYYKDAEADDAEHIKALEKDMKDDKRSSMNESLEILKMRKLAGLLTEGEYAKALLRENNSLEDKIQQWVNDNAGGYGPEEDDPNYDKFTMEMKTLLSNTLEVEDFIDKAIDIIADYTMSYYGDSTSFSPNDIKDEFYEFIK